MQPRRGRVDGYSFLTCRVNMRPIADMLGKPVSVNNSYDSTGTGALLLSQKEMGVYGNLKDAAKLFHCGPVIILIKRSLYMKYFAVFEKRGHKLKNEFEETALLHN